MEQIRHIGLYVKNLSGMVSFYKEVFNMTVVCENVKQKDALIGDLLKEDGYVATTKLITEYGRRNRTGDMLELIQYNAPTQDYHSSTCTNLGVMHIAFRVNVIEEIIEKVKRLGGSQYTKIHLLINGNKCCFCQDPEGNWLELIEPGNDKH